MEKKREMTVQEAGRLGGAKIVEKYGREHMSEIGRKGGKASTTKFVAGDPETSRIASKGGTASSGNFANNPKRAAEAGRKGGFAKKRARLTSKESTPAVPES